MKVSPLTNVELIDQLVYTINAVVISKPILTFIGPKKNILKFKVKYNEQELQINIFNRIFLKNQIRENELITIKGKYNLKYNSINASEILTTPIIKETYVKKYANLTKNKVTIKQELFDNIVMQILGFNFMAVISKEIQTKYKLCSRAVALQNIHNPQNDLDVINALRYLKFEELYLYFLQLETLLANKHTRIPLKYDLSCLEEDIANFGYSLTSKQHQTLAESIQDLTKTKTSSRLIQGDVGSGKSIVAFLIMSYVVKQQKKAIMIAPTTILASQHYEDLKKLFPSYRILEVNSKTLNTNLSQKIANNEYDILIGTTSILSNKIKLDKDYVDAVIIDEQQRFGVKQRAKLEINLPHICSYYMSATPIPRTMELSLLGYINTSIIDEYPKHRKEV